MTEKFKKYNSDYILIPPGLTCFIQSLDVSLNCPLKKELQYQDIDYRIRNLNHKKPNSYDVIDAVNHLWYNDNIINENIISKSFKTTVISVILDVSENYMIKKNEEICEEIIIPSEFIDDLEKSDEKQVKKEDINGKQV